MTITAYLLHVLTELPQRAPDADATDLLPFRYGEQMKARPPSLDPIAPAAVYELCTREVSAQDVASKLDVSQVTLYNWKRQLLGRDDPVSIKRDKQSPSETDRDDLRSRLKRSDVIFAI